MRPVRGEPGFKTLAQPWPNFRSWVSLDSSSTGTSRRDMQTATKPQAEGFIWRTHAIHRLGGATKSITWRSLRL
jgi:hypothetical protein